MVVARWREGGNGTRYVFGDWLWVVSFEVSCYSKHYNKVKGNMNNIIKGNTIVR